MYRQNETSLVSAVLAAKLANDVPAAVDAAVQLWLSPWEDEGPDTAAIEVWNALGELDAIPAAVQAGTRVLRDGRRIRPHAFIDLTEHITDSERLAEVATSALAAGWPANPYLAAPFARLVERNDNALLEAFIKSHRDRLHRDLETWILVGFTLTTSKVGNRDDVDAWFKGWEARANVPMWLVAAYAASISQLGDLNWKRMIRLARAALACASPDASAPLLATFTIVDELTSNNVGDDLVGRLRANQDELERHLASPRIDQPLVQYANAVKHVRPIQEDDFQFSRPVDHGSGMSISVPITVSVRPPDWWLIELLEELPNEARRYARVLPLIAEMIPLERGDKRAVELAVAMSKSRPSQIPMLRPVWKRLLKERLSWLQRFKVS